MKEFVISEAKAETAILVGLITPQQGEAKTREYLDELAFLAETAGAVVAFMNSEKAKVIGCSSFASTAASVRSSQMRGAVSAHYPLNTPAEKCYYTTSSLSDPMAKLMAKEDAANTDFLTLMKARDEYLKGAKAGLAVSDYNYDLTLNGRTFSHDGNWNVLCLPFDVSTHVQRCDRHCH